MNSNWPIVPFTAVFKDVTSGSPRLPQSDYMAAGLFPVVDQGAREVSGFTDDHSMLARCRLPVVVFGDHTRRFKLVDQPFVVGADGVKLLETVGELDARFALHYLRSLSIQNAGYSRHFKFLREVMIVLPPLPEQRRIASILEQSDRISSKGQVAEDLLAKSRQAEFDRLEDSIWSMPGRSEPLVKITIGGAGVRAGPFGSSLKKSDYVPKGYRVYGQEQVIAGDFGIGDYFIGEQKFLALRAHQVHSGDVLVSAVGTFGRVAIVPTGIEPGIINPRLLKVSPDLSRVLPEYLAALIKGRRAQTALRKMSHGGTMGIINASLLKEIPVRIPTLAVQQSWLGADLAIQGVVGKLGEQRAHAAELFASLQHRAFRGEL